MHDKFESGCDRYYEKKKNEIFPQKWHIIFYGAAQTRWIIL